MLKKQIPITILLTGLLIMTVLTACPDPGGGGDTPSGGKIGEIKGTITLTDIPSPAPKVYIYVSDSNYNWHSKDSQINLNSLTGTGATLNWSIPVYDNDGFNPSEGYFHLWVEVSENNSYGISIPARPYIPGANANVGDLGLVSLRYITLSGTINVTVNEQPVPYLTISASRSNGYGSTRLTSPRANAAWSMYLPASDYQTEISFWVSGYQEKDGNWIFGEDINPYPPVYASDQNISEISLNLGNIKTITLSGTINVTVNGQPVPRVEIEARGEYSSYYTRSYSTQLTSPGANAQWSITMQAFDYPTPVYFNVRGLSTKGDTLFYEDIQSLQVSAYDQNISGISLNLGNIKTITLSGTLNVTLDGQPVPRVEIRVGSDEYYYWKELGSTRLTSPGANASWSITLRPFDDPTPVYFNVYGYSANGYEQLFSRTPDITVNAYDKNISGITINLGNIVNPNTPVNPTPLTANTWADGNIATSDGVQWFEFTATNSTQYIHINFGSLSDLYVQVFNSSYNAVGDRENLYGYTYTSLYLTVGQKYYIKVWPFNYGGTYQIAFNTSPVAPGAIISNDPGTEGNPIPLAANEWKDGSITYNTPNGEVWYSFNVTGGNTYYVWWNDRDAGDDSKTLDVKVAGYYANGSLAFYEEDSAWSYPQYFTASSTGTVKLRVVPYYYNTGTFAIAYSANNIRPGSNNSGTEANPIPLTANEWKDGIINSPRDDVWYSFNVVQGTLYNVWWNDKNEGNYTKTLDVMVSGYYTNGVSPIFEFKDSAWSRPEYFTAFSSGTVKLKVSPRYYSGDTGTFAIVYSTGALRP